MHNGCGDPEPEFVIEGRSPLRLLISTYVEFAKLSTVHRVMTVPGFASLVEGPFTQASHRRFLASEGI